MFTNKISILFKYVGSNKQMFTSLPLHFLSHFQLNEWSDIGIANLPGVISLLAGLFMWVTSFAPVRRWNFELFFYTHQLYVVFVVFLALHVGDFIFTMAAGGIFLFVLDRFLRFCQSRRTVNVISAKCLPCGTVELVLSKPRSNYALLPSLNILPAYLCLYHISNDISF